MSTSTKVRESFAKNLKNMLSEAGIKQFQFAKMMGVSASCVSKWLLAEREPTLGNIVKMLKILECSFDDLISKF